MRAVDEIVGDILEDIRDVAQGRINKADVMRAINEAKNLAVTKLLESGERLTAFLSTSGLPLILGVTGGDPKVILPIRFARIIRVEAKFGTGYMPITEDRSAEVYPIDTDLPDALTRDTQYQIMWPYLFLRPPPSTTDPTGLRLYHENSVPALIMGQVVASSDPSHVTLASVVNRTIGQYPASSDDSAYNEMSIVFTNAAGTVRQIAEIANYVGATRICGLKAALGQAIDATWTYAMMTPFTRTFEVCDDYIMARAPVVLGTTKRPFDVSGYSARANELEEQIEQRASPLTNSARGFLPFDLANG